MARAPLLTPSPASSAALASNAASSQQFSNRRLLLALLLWALICVSLFLLNSLAFLELGQDDARRRLARQSHRHALASTKLDESALHAATSDSFNIGQQLRKSPTIASNPVSSSTSVAATTTTLTTTAATINSSKSVFDQCRYSYPPLSNLKFSNIYWQVFESQIERNSSVYKTTFYLYNAYFDDRKRLTRPSVRILAMIDRIKPPPVNCLFWPKEALSVQNYHRASHNEIVLPLIGRAKYVYAWYPKWGNYKDGKLQPFVVTCALPKDAAHNFVPASVTLVDVATTTAATLNANFNDNIDYNKQIKLKQKSNKHKSPLDDRRHKRELSAAEPAAVVPAFSSSAAPQLARIAAAAVTQSATDRQQRNNKYATTATTTLTTTNSMQNSKLNCAQTLPLTNVLVVNNERPSKRQTFAVCVKGLDFLDEDISTRLVEWLELLSTLGASKVFLYNLNVNENTSKVLSYYKKLGLVELTPLTLPGSQPNLPEYQHAYLKAKLTTKRQNELIPYNDCLYRNLYSYKYLALLDIDEIIMPLGNNQSNDWHALMQNVEKLALRNFDYTRASYNFRNVYFFDDQSITNQQQQQQHATQTTSSPSSSTTTTSNAPLLDADARAERELKQIPPYLHMMQHVYRSKNYTKPEQYVKCFHNVERVVTLHNHFPLNCFGQCTTYSVPTTLAHLQHYRKDCVGALQKSCKSDFKKFTIKDTTIWKYKSVIDERATKVLQKLNLIATIASNKSSVVGDKPTSDVNTMLLERQIM